MINSLKLNNIELLPDLIYNIPDITITKGEYGQVSFIPNISVNCNNNYGTFSKDGIGSFFNGKTLKDIRKMRVELTKLNKVKWSGFVKTFPVINTRDKIATMNCITIHEKTLSDVRNCEYISQTPETPAEVFKNLLDRYGLGSYLNLSSYNKSKKLQENGSHYIFSNVYGFNAFPLSDVIQQLALISCAYVYVNKDNEFVFEVFDPDSSYITTCTIEESEYNNLVINPVDIVPFDDFNITTLSGDVTLGLADPENKFDGIQGSIGEMFEITATGGFYLGNLFIEQSKSQESMVEFDLLWKLEELFDIGKNIRINNTQQNLNEKLIEITEISYSDNLNQIHVKGITHE